MRRPFGYFVHHQGRGHAERCAALLHALPADRPVTVFCARPTIFPAMPPQVTVVEIPSLFEEVEPAPPGLGDFRTPVTMHCAPLGWPTITEAIATITGWLHQARPELFIVDVSAELAQLARIASVPAVFVLQHGDRSDPGHMAGYESCVGFLAPYHEALEQPDRPPWIRPLTHYAPGLGASIEIPEQAVARAQLGLDNDREMILILSGRGGSGAPLAPLTMGARATPDTVWIAIGSVAREWHETIPGNLELRGWTDTPNLFLAAADVVISAAGNTAIHMVLQAGRPSLVIPEWRYFDEQREKARALARNNAAHVLDSWPATSHGWAGALASARRIAAESQRALLSATAAEDAAGWLENLARCLWHQETTDLAGRIAAE